jgi:hypothetical protein
LKGIVDGGLEKTAQLWPEVAAGFELVHEAATILANDAQHSGAAVREEYRQHLKTMKRKRPKTGALREAIDHFLKTTESYWPGLFHCYDVPDLPRTNNDLEQLFGATRCHERRCTGRKVASPGLVLRGPVRLVAAMGTRQRTYSGEELAPTSVKDWRTLRAGLERRRQSRVLRSRFRRDPAAYLRQLEELLLKNSLPV